MHPQVEAIPKKREGIVGWNNSKRHKRKFITAKGKYVGEKESEKEGQLAFWGEWEAQSEVEFIEKGQRSRYLQTPYIDLTEANRTHNTDPYVFGDCFKYIGCMQGRYKVLRDLPPMSLIMFGSRINNQFCLDTLFVVSEKQSKYETTESLIEIHNKKDQFYYASIEPLCNDGCKKKKCKSDKATYYDGVNFKGKANFKGIYSFIPCRLQTKENDFTFERPVIDLDIISPNQTQGINAKGVKEYTIEEIKRYWLSIVEQVKRKDLLIGTQIETPKFR